MKNQTKTYIILLANDRKEFQLLIEEALSEIPLCLQLFCVQDGEEILDYLYRHKQYQSPETSPHPDLILLDLNMPRKDGREVITEIKAHPKLRHIPVLILTTSKQDGDVSLCYNAGANSFINLPFTFNELVDVLQKVCQYWFETVILPPNPDQ